MAKLIIGGIIIGFVIAAYNFLFKDRDFHLESFNPGEEFTEDELILNAEIEREEKEERRKRREERENLNYNFEKDKN